MLLETQSPHFYYVAYSINGELLQYTLLHYTLLLQFNSNSAYN